MRIKLIVGLGNPGRIYTDSRHNIGFAVIKSLSQIYKAPLKKDNHTFSLSGKGRIEDENVILALPLTFMNLSGDAVSALIRKYKIGKPRSCAQGRGLPDLLVVCDDLDLKFGAMKIRPSGSSGGHNGLQSIIDSLGSREFSRLRIGIGRPQDRICAADYVLSPFNKKEKNNLKEIIEDACDCCRAWLTKGVIGSMNIFNRRNKINSTKGTKE